MALKVKLFTIRLNTVTGIFENTVVGGFLVLNCIAYYLISPYLYCLKMYKCWCVELVWSWKFIFLTRNNRFQHI